MYNLIRNQDGVKIEEIMYDVSNRRHTGSLSAKEFITSTFGGSLSVNDYRLYENTLGYVFIFIMALYSVHYFLLD
jgi:hypothetical protein